VMRTKITHKEDEHPKRLSRPQLLKEVIGCAAPICASCGKLECS
jgi:hypothetical protein